MEISSQTLDPILLVAIVGGVLLALGLGFWFGRSRAQARLGEPEEEELTERIEPSGAEPLEESDVAPQEEPLQEAPDLFGRLTAGLSRTRSALSAGLDAVFARGRLDEEAFEALEEALISADVGVKVSMKLTEALREDARRGGLDTPVALRAALRERITELLAVHDSAMAPGPKDGPLVVLVVGINGGGKTTTIGKLAARYKRQGKRVLLGAGDTFRAGAIQQLRIWAEERAGVDIVAHEEGADAAAVLFDTIRAATSRGHDVVICDTAGRLQSRGPLMDELSKVGRVLGKAREGAPDEVLLVLDATIGQNALSQARLFGEAVGVTGIVLTKLDGTAKGGVVIAVSDEMGLPVKFVGVGEQVDDLRPFDAEAFATALLADPDEIETLESA